MRELKIKFLDFWPGFIDDNNYFFHLLSSRYKVIIADDPELIFYSCYGKEYLCYNCTRIFYCAENMRPDFFGCDYAITFDYNHNPRHFRLPLFLLHVDRTNCLKQLTEAVSAERARKIWQSKTKFCCIVVSNPNAKRRIQFFKKLSLIKHIDSGGRHLNNVGGPVDDKLDFIKDYKFVISFENSVSDGYTTEKIIEPLMVNSIPIYWGNKMVRQDINPETFIDISNFRSDQEVFKKIIAIDANDDLALPYIMAPKLANEGKADYLDKEKVMAFLEKAIRDASQNKSVALSWKKYVHAMRRALLKLRVLVISKTVGYFR